MASAEMGVNGDGTLVTRPDGSVDNPDQPYAIKPLATRSTHMERALSSTMPDKYFKQLEFFEISNDFGSSLAVRVHAVLRLPKRDSHCGSVLVLVTHLGRITLDGEDMTFDDDVGQVFAEAGFGIDNNPENALSYRRRRLSDGAAVVGLFNFVAGQEEEWSCPDIPAPDIPTDYTMTMVTWKPCRFVEDCSYDQFDGSFLLYPGAVIQPDDTLAVVVRETLHVKGGSRVVKVTEYPSRPFQVHVVDMDFASGERREFDAVFDDASRIYRCAEANIPPGVPSGDLLATANFQYVGEADDSTRYFKISYKVEIEGEVDYHHMHFYDDLLTHQPRRIVHDDGTQSQITAFTEGFGEPQFAYTDDQFDECLAETVEFAANKTMDSFEDVRPPTATAFSAPQMTPFWNNELARRGLSESQLFEFGHSTELSRYLYNEANGTQRFWEPPHSNNLRRVKSKGKPEDALTLYFNHNNEAMSITAKTGIFEVKAELKWDASGFKSLAASGEGCMLKVLCASGDISWNRGGYAKGCIKLAFKPSGLLDLPYIDSLPSFLVSLIKKILTAFDQDLMSICVKSDAGYLGDWTGDYYKGGIPTLHIANAFNLEARASLQLLGLLKIEAYYDMFATKSRCSELSSPRHFATKQTYHMLGMKGYIFNYLPWVWDWEDIFTWRIMDQRRGRGGTCQRCARWFGIASKPHMSSLQRDTSSCPRVSSTGNRCGSKCPGYKLPESGSL